MDGYGYNQGPQGPPQGQNPSGMPYPFVNQPMSCMPMPVPTQSTPYPNNSAPYPSHQPAPYPNHQPAPYPNHQPAPYPNHQPAPYPNHQPAPYPNQQPAPYPGHQPAPYPGQPPQAQAYPGAYPQHATAYPGQVMSQPPQQPYHQEQHCGIPSPATGACVQSNMAYNYSAPPTNYHQASSCSIVAKLTPTVLHNPSFNAVNDAEALRKAMKGFGTDEKTIISILCNRNNEHRQKIEKSFKTLYGKDLIKDLKSELSGKFEDLIVAMMTPIIDYYVIELHDSISGIGTNEDVLIIILCTLKNQDIHKICETYKNKYGKSLESDIRGDTSGHFERLMVSLCTGQRDETTYTDINSAKNDATRLYNAGVGTLGTNESEFNSIFAQRNVHQLKLIFQEYSKLCGHDISTAIEREFSGYIKKALLAIVECVNNSALYFAKKLNKSMSGAGTEDKTLIFICVTRSEVDMGDIKKAYVQKYGKTLEKRISEDTSGHYKKCLLELIA